MEFTIKQNKENVLLNRKEISGSVTFNKETISNNNLKELLAKELKTEADFIVVKHIYTDFGKKNAKFTALVYKSKEDKNSLEPLTKHLKNKIEEEKKKAAEAKKGEQ